MLNLASLDNLPLILVCVVPGFIILSVRSQFLTGRSASHSTPLLAYMTVSFIYNAFAYPFIACVLSKSQFSFIDIFFWFVLIVAIPAVFGLLLGRISARRNWLHRFLRSCGFNNTVHPIATAWDWKFGTMPEQWVIITLKDSTYFGGFCGKESFISSESDERDLYVQQVYDISDCGKWQLRKGTSVLIVASQVSRIEFINPSSRGNSQ